MVLQVQCVDCDNVTDLVDKRSIKMAKFKDNYRCKNCALNFKRKNNRIKLLKDHFNIDWNKTLKIYGHDYNNIQKTNKVFCRCLSCNKELTVVYKTPKSLFNTANRIRHKKCFKHNEITIIKSKMASKKYWNNNESYEIASQIVSGLWRDEAYRNKIISSLISADHSEKSDRS